MTVCEEWCFFLQMFRYFDTLMVVNPLCLRNLKVTFWILHIQYFEDAIENAYDTPFLYLQIALKSANGVEPVYRKYTKKKGATNLPQVQATPDKGTTKINPLTVIYPKNQRKTKTTCNNYLYTVKTHRCCVDGTDDSTSSKHVVPIPSQSLNSFF